MPPGKEAQRIKSKLRRFVRELEVTVFLDQGVKTLYHILYVLATDLRVGETDEKDYGLCKRGGRDGGGGGGGGVS